MSARPALVPDERYDPAEDVPAEKTGGSAPAPAPALGYSMVCNLDGNRQLTVQCFVSEDEALGVINGKMDKAFAIIDRQKARYDILTLKDELATHEKGLRQLTEDLARVDVDYARQQAQLDVQIEEAQRLLEARQEEVYAANVETGRSPGRKAQGYKDVDISRAKAGIANYAKEKARKEADRQQHRENVMVNEKRFIAEVSRLKFAIEEKESLVAAA